MDKSLNDNKLIETLTRYVLAASEIEKADARAKKALKRVLKEVDKLARRPHEVFGIEQLSAHAATLEAGLLEVCKNYFREEALSKMRKNMINREELIQLREDCEKLFETWKRLSPQSLFLLVAEFNLQKFSLGFDPKKLKHLSRAVGAIVDERKQRDDQIPAVKSAAKRCSELLKDTGAIEIFPENFSRHKGEYTSAPARFIDAILKSIDKNIAMTQIKTAIRHINK